MPPTKPWARHSGATSCWNASAKAAIGEARQLLLRAPAPVTLEIQVATQYAAILGSAHPAEAEQFARETLAKLPSLDSEVRDANFELRGEYLNLVGELSNTLCRQDRFAEATAMLEEQGRDRGNMWWIAYQAEIRQREAEALFQAKGIPPARAGREVKPAQPA